MVPSLAIWVCLLLVTRVWGLQVAAGARGDLALGAMPLFGEWDLRLGFAAFVAASVAVLAVVVAPVALERLRWSRLVVLTGIAAAGWALALAGVDGARVIGESIHRDYGEHIHLVDDAGGPRAFADRYVDLQATFPVHLQAHPPGLPLFLWSAAEAGVTGPVWYVALPIASTAVAAAAAVVVMAEVGGRDLARRAAPFVAFAPAAVWRVNADAFFAGPTLAAIALVVVATGRRGRRRDLLAAGGGATFGAAMLLTYGVSALALPAVAVAAARRQWRVLALAALGGLVVLLAPLAAGFSWWAGLHATRRQYAASIASIRPYSYFVVANLAVAALALGPAVAVGWRRLPRPTWALVGGATASLLLVDLSGLSKSEVERIWQPFFPLLLLAGAGVAASRAATRRWLAVQVLVAVVLQCSLRSPW